MTEAEMLAEAEDIACAEDWDSNNDKIRAIADLVRRYASEWDAPQAVLASITRAAESAIAAERVRWREALQSAANSLMWAGSVLCHAWAQERPPDKESAEDAWRAEQSARAALAADADAAIAALKSIP